ncbi:MAG: GntP family permease [Cellvibrionaceae bacterium]|nr:GntP family permease [Cellvibrionaceae bacterium]
MLSIIGLAGALTLLIVLTIRGMNLLIAAPLCALIVALTSGLQMFPPLDDKAAVSFVTSYMSGFSGFVAAWFFMFLLGSLFGKLMEDSGSADSIALWITSHIGQHNAALAVVLACAILTYGGVSVFVVAFAAYPMAVSLFKRANLPRRFIPAVMAFGSVTFTMTSAGSPEIQNWIPIEYLGTSPYAAWEVSAVVAVAMAAMGFIWLQYMLKKAVANGEQFIAREGDKEVSEHKLPSPVLAMIPIAAVLGVTFFTHEIYGKYALIVALLAGCIAAALINTQRLGNMSLAIGVATTGALLAIGNTAAVVGFGSVAKASPAFAMAVDAITGIPGDALIGAAIAVTTIAALTGSASGGQSIALPILGPHYVDAGVDPEALHRVIAISSGALDSLPHNGYVVTTIRAICGETHKDAYWPMGALTVVVPLIGTALAILLLI